MNLKTFFLQQHNITKRSHFETFTFSYGGTLPFSPTTWHEEFLVAKVVDGVCDIIIDGVSYHLEQSDICVLTPFTLYTLQNAVNINLDYCLVNLRALQHNKNTITYPSSANMYCVVKFTEEKHSQINQAILQLKQDRNLDHMCLIDIQNILHWLHKKPADKNITNDKHLFAIKNALNIVHTQRNQIVVAQLAQTCGYSEFYMMKLFKKFTGMSCIDYVVRYRLVQITLEMLTTDKDICEIATKYGFANISYFNRQFKKLFGITPKELRKQPIQAF